MSKHVVRVCLVVLSVILLSQAALAQVTLQFMGWEASPLETESDSASREGLKNRTGIKVEHPVRR